MIKLMFNSGDLREKMINIWQKYAKILSEYSLNIQKGDTVIIKGEAQAEPLILALYEEILKKDAHPIVRLTLNGMMDSYFRISSDNQLDYVDPFTVYEYEKANKFISITAPYNVKNLTKINPAKLSRRSKSTKILTDIFYKRSAKGKLKWVTCNFPCNSLAQESRMSLDDYEQLLIKACCLHFDDPVKKWIEIREKQQKIVNFLNNTKTLHFTGYKTDLKLSVAGRKWLNGCGLSNFPDGEVCTSPVENSAEGEIYFEDVSIFRGNEVTGICLKFEKGKIVSATAEKGEAFLNSMINQDEGAKRVGEIAFGTNEMIKEITGNILFDEKIGKSIHMALGFSIPGTGGKNKSALHWDIVKLMQNGGKAYADDKLIYENGEFII